MGPIGRGVWVSGRVRITVTSWAPAAIAWVRGSWSTTPPSTNRSPPISTARVTAPGRDMATQHLKGVRSRQVQVADLAVFDVRDGHPDRHARAPQPVDVERDAPAEHLVDEVVEIEEGPASECAADRKQLVAVQVVPPDVEPFDLACDRVGCARAAGGRCPDLVERPLLALVQGDERTGRVRSAHPAALNDEGSFSVHAATDLGRRRWRTGP